MNHQHAGFGDIDPLDRVVWRLHHRDSIPVSNLAHTFGEPATAITRRLRAYEAATDFTTALEAQTIPRFARAEEQGTRRKARREA